MAGCFMNSEVELQAAKVLCQSSRRLSSHLSISRAKLSLLQKTMTSETESVEIIEVTWKIPNFLQNAGSKNRPADFSRTFFVGGGGSAADPQNWFLIELRKLRNDTLHKWSLHLTAFDRPQGPSPSPLLGSLLELRIVWRGKTLRQYNLKRAPMDFRTRILYAKLFDLSEPETHLDQDDGSLTINLKMEFTFSIAKANAAKTLAGGVAELVNDFESLLKDRRYADVEIRVSMGRGRNFHCHKAILAARSEVFRAMFESDMKETNEGVVEVDDILPKTMEHFLSFVYCGRFQDSSWIQSLPQLAYAADKYCVDSLKEVCDLNLIECVTSRNALALGKLAERHGLMNAAQKIRRFLARNAKVVTLDSEVDYRDENLKVRYSIPDAPTKTATETETQDDEETT